MILPLLKSSSKANKDVACEQVLRRGALAAGLEKEGELETAPMEFEFQFPCGSSRLSCQIFADQREAETSANVNKL